MKAMRSVAERANTIPGEFVLRKNLATSPISEIYLCTLNNIKAVVRFDAPCASVLAIHRANEVIVLNSIQDLQLSPRILYHNQLEGVLIWKFIAGEEFSFDLAHQRESYLQSLGKGLKLIHSQATPPECLDIFSNSLSLYQSLLQEAPSKSLADKASSLYESLSNDGSNYVLSHNDLNRSNLLWCNKVYFLDWEYSGPNHPCFDIASLVKTYNLMPAEITYLADGYDGDHELFKIDTLNQWMQFISYLDEIWEIAVTTIQAQLKIKID